MKNILLLFFLAVNSLVHGQTSTYDYAYLRKAKIYVYSIADKKELFVTNDGVNPNISPEGKKLAYTIIGKDTKMGPTRFIGVIDLNTKSKIILNTHDDNCYGPIWSPDGKWIAYNVSNKKNWSIAFMGSANSTSPKFISAENSFSPHWLSGGTSIISHNMQKITVYDLTGKTIKNYNMQDLEGGLHELKGMIGSANSDDFIPINDNKKIVFNCMVNEPGEDGPPSAVFVYDINSKKTLRVSPKGYSANNLAINNNKVFFAASKIDSEEINTYSVDLDGNNYKLFLANCYSMSLKQ
ncbi:hypothetical protein FO440_11765 [Mucilaginibacter corticis]|uniref:DUF5050 domain-containing protein n=1 Tax=Mucilaginibacter corticis TaxID=2597670 RepID=A0A556MKN9_9SPHI|nr:PD40 domain-containing protein [Mucilaginibacter corticis]TSJ40428.1 hypothetical protein FO440_11765 [Mucilaginibacter corticis]